MGAVPFFSGWGSWVLNPHLTQCAWAEAFLRTKWHLDPTSHLATTDVGRKLGAVPLFRGEQGPHLKQCCMGWGLPLYQVASCSKQPFGHNRHRPKIGGLCPFADGGAGSSI